MNGERLGLAKTSFMAERSSASPALTLVRRRSTSKLRSARLVVRTLMRCRPGTRWAERNALRSSSKEAVAEGKLAAVGVEHPVCLCPGGMRVGAPRMARTSAITSGVPVVGQLGADVPKG